MKRTQQLTFTTIFTTALRGLSAIILTACALSTAQAATALPDSILAQPIAGFSKIDRSIIAQVQQDAQKPIFQQQQLQRRLATERGAQLQQLNYDFSTFDFLNTERLSRLSTQTREQRTANDLFVANLEASTVVNFLIDKLAIAGQEIEVQNVKGTVIIQAQINP